MADSKLREMNEILSYPQNRYKNSVSLLLEIAAQVGESVFFHPVEELLGLSSMRLFTCEVKVGSLFKCKGTGNNKKTAKASAAQQALEMIKNKAGVNMNLLGSPQVSPSHSLQTASPAHSLSNPAPSNSSPNTEGNPIGSLQELCMKNNWTPPSYDLVHDSGEAHSKTFIYECKIDSWVAQGQGKSKKSAKRIAADNMLNMIRGSPSKNPSSTDSSSRNVRDNSLGTSPVISLQQGQSSVSSGCSSKPVPYLLSQLNDHLASDDDVDNDEDDNDNLTRLIHPFSHSVIDDGVNEEFCSSLEEKGNQCRFSVEYHDFSQKGSSGNYLCFVRLNTTPPTVCSGMGLTKTSAHEKAAQSALHYLNIVSS